MTEAQEVAQSIYNCMSKHESSNLSGLSEETLIQYTKQFIPNESNVITSEVNSWLHTLINRIH